jgi:hypothetical protein
MYAQYTEQGAGAMNELVKETVKVVDFFFFGLS